jgi:hypothetical protein
MSLRQSLVLSCLSILFWSIECQYLAMAQDILNGTIGVYVTNDKLTIEEFDRARFPEFSRQSLRNYFGEAKQIRMITRATSRNSVQDIEVVGPAQCLAPEIGGFGWQRLRFEFSYGIDDAHLAETSHVRYEIQVRLISGEAADFRQGGLPPEGRYRQVNIPQLTDLAYKLAGFISREMSRSCFNRLTLTFCPDQSPKACK